MPTPSPSPKFTLRTATAADSLDLDSTDPLLAKMRAPIFRTVRSAGGSSVSSPKAASGHDSSTTATDHVCNLKRMVAEQEKLRKKLEEGNIQKEQQLLQMHDRLEESLSILQASQRTYAEQQQVMDAQKVAIQKLLQRLHQRGRKQVAGAACSVSSTRSASIDNGTRLPGGISSDASADEVEFVNRVLGPLMKRTDELQSWVQKLEETRPGANGPSSLAGAQQAQAPAVLAQLQALVAEKNELEAQLHREQSQLEEELSSLQAQMRGGGTVNSGKPGGA